MYSAVHPAPEWHFPYKNCFRPKNVITWNIEISWLVGWRGAVIEAAQCFIGILFPRHFKYSIHTQPSLLQGLDISNNYTYIPTTQSIAKIRQQSAKKRLKLMTNLKFAFVCGPLEMPWNHAWKSETFLIQEFLLQLINQTKLEFQIILSKSCS